MMDRIAQELEYWEKAAQDPEVMDKYICDLPLDKCIEAIIKGLEAYEIFKILDLGCGIGRLTNAMAEKYNDVYLYGVDISPKMLKLAPRADNIKYLLSDGRTIPLQNDEVHLLYTMLLFQHLPPDAVFNYIKEAARVLTKGGLLRFQFIEGTEREPFSYHYEYSEVINWLTTAGFFTLTYEKGLVHEQWTWVTAIKI